MDARPLLAVGIFDRRQRSSLSLAAREAAYDVEVLSSVRDATQWLEAHSAHGVLVRDDGDGAESLGLAARAQARHAQMPILSLADDLDDLSFAGVFSWGGDDAVSIGAPRGLVPRLRGLPKELPDPPRNGRGTALICDGDRARRVVLGRVLRNAGYTIEFAITGDEVTRKVADRSPELVVANAHASDDPVALAADARAGGSRAVWIVTCAPRELTQHRPSVEQLGNATAADGFAPPENIVFLANELARGGAVDNRQSRRLLYGTTVAFRGAGRETDDHGYSYNISRGGLYVRTLAPPEDPTVWLELRPPRSDRRIRLEGRVVWRRPFGPTGNATVPPGFAVEIVDGSRADRDEWARAYGSFAEVLGF
jgi:DNA-binding response OmpR family regulator